MLRQHLCAAFGIALLAALLSTHPLAAQLRVGGGAGFLFDESTDYTVVQGQLRLSLGRSGWVIAPGAERFSGLHVTQFDLDLLYQIRTAANGILQPYAGIGGGINHLSDGEFSETKKVLNLITGARIVPRHSRLEFYLESHYTEGKDFTNTEVLYGGVLLRVGGR